MRSLYTNEGVLASIGSFKVQAGSRDDILAVYVHSGYEAVQLCIPMCVLLLYVRVCVYAGVHVSHVHVYIVCLFVFCMVCPANQ